MYIYKWGRKGDNYVGLTVIVALGKDRHACGSRKIDKMAGRRSKVEDIILDDFTEQRGVRAQRNARVDYTPRVASLPWDTPAALPPGAGEGVAPETLPRSSVSDFRNPLRPSVPHAAFAPDVVTNFAISVCQTQTHMRTPHNTTNKLFWLVIPRKSLNLISKQPTVDHSGRAV